MFVQKELKAKIVLMQVFLLVIDASYSFGFVRNDFGPFLRPRECQTPRLFENHTDIVFKDLPFLRECLIVLSCRFTILMPCTLSLCRKRLNEWNSMKSGRRIMAMALPVPYTLECVYSEYLSVKQGQMYATILCKDACTLYDPQYLYCQLVLLQACLGQCIRHCY